MEWKIDRKRERQRGTDRERQPHRKIDRWEMHSLEYNVCKLYMYDFLVRRNNSRKRGIVAERGE